MLCDIIVLCLMLETEPHDRRNQKPCFENALKPWLSVVLLATPIGKKSLSILSSRFLNWTDARSVQCTLYTFPSIFCLCLVTKLRMVYRIRGNFRGMYISRSSHYFGFSRLKFHG